MPLSVPLPRLRPPSPKAPPSPKVLEGASSRRRATERQVRAPLATPLVHDSLSPRALPMQQFRRSVNPTVAGASPLTYSSPAARRRKLSPSNERLSGGAGSGAAGTTGGADASKLRRKSPQPPSSPPLADESKLRRKSPQPPPSPAPSNARTSQLAIFSSTQSIFGSTVHGGGPPKSKSANPRGRRPQDLVGHGRRVGTSRVATPRPGGGSARPTSNFAGGAFAVGGRGPTPANTFAGGSRQVAAAGNPGRDTAVNWRFESEETRRYRQIKDQVRLRPCGCNLCDISATGWFGL